MTKAPRQSKRFLSRADAHAAAFAFRVWLATTLLAPVFTAGYYGFADVSFKRVLATYGAFVLAGGLFSAPSFLAFAILCMVVVSPNLQFTRGYRKIILSVLGVLFTAIPFSLIGLGIFGGDILLFLPYAGFVIAGIWFFKLVRNEPDEDVL